MSGSIVINFWDDFYDDGHVPEGKVQETYAYVESPISLPSTVRLMVLQAIKEHIETEYFTIVDDGELRLEDCGKYKGQTNWRLTLSPITHEQLEALVTHLEQSVTWARIISES